MREQKLYICDYCGTQYKEKVRCAECESHILESQKSEI